MTATKPRQTYLYGIQGLRTVAALLVAVYHIWFGRVSGGVDVFFVVAGYFAVGSLYRAFNRARTSKEVWEHLGAYLLRILRRVVPSAAVVLTATVLLSWLWLPKTAQRSALPSGWAAIGFLENWQLIASSADYAAQENAASPFQQFWALAVNVQFYFMFALIVAVLAAAIRARLPKSDLRRPLALMATLIFIGSLWFSIHATALNQPAAYFNTFARLWEFMAGALLFLLMQSNIANRVVAAALGWVGLLILLFLGAFVDLSHVLPGYLSLIPVAAACAIIVSSRAQAEPSPLLWTPVQRIADASFALYLWHWPLLVIYRHQFGTPVSWWGGIGIIVLSTLLALGTTKFIENPLRYSALISRSWRTTIAVMLSLLLIPAASLLAWQTTLNREEQEAWAAARSLTAASQSEAQYSEVTIADLVPHPAIAQGDAYRDVIDERCIQSSKAPGVQTCIWGNEESDVRVVLVGGSHSEQWAQSVRRATDEANVKMQTYLKSSCVFSTEVTKYIEVDQTCLDWNEEVLQDLLNDPPDLVVTMGTRVRNGEEWIPDGYREVFEILAANGIPVLALRDNPASANLSPTCLEKNKIEACAIARDEVYGPLSDLNPPENELIDLLDLSDLYCDADECRAVDGMVTQYRDTHHLTSTWVRLNDQPVVDAIRSALGR